MPRSADQGSGVDAVLSLGCLSQSTARFRPAGSVGTDRYPGVSQPLRSGDLHHGALNDDAAGTVCPRRDEELSSERNNNRVAAVFPPLRWTHSWNKRLSTKVRLVSQPQPGELYHRRFAAGDSRPWTPPVH